MPKFFISYRRSDQEGQYLAHMIFRELRSRYGPDSAFLDVDSRSPGLSFPAKVTEALKVTDVVLVIIGPLWLQRLNERLEDSRDWVRYEVAESLKRDSLPVVPICKAGVEIPRPHELPEDLRDLSWRDGITLDPFQDFDAHLARLLSDLEAMLATSRRKKKARLLSDLEAILAMLRRKKKVRLLSDLEAILATSRRQKEERIRKASAEKRTAPQPVGSPPSASKVSSRPTAKPNPASKGVPPAKSSDPMQSWWQSNQQELLRGGLLISPAVLGGACVLLGLRSEDVLVLLAIVCGLGIVYLHFAVEIYRRLAPSKKVPHSLLALLTPASLWNNLCSINRTSDRAIGGFKPTGLALWIIWILEASVVFGMSLVIFFWGAQGFR